MQIFGKILLIVAAVSYGFWLAWGVFFGFFANRVSGVPVSEIALHLLNPFNAPGFSWFFAPLLIGGGVFSAWGKVKAVREALPDDANKTANP